MSVHSFGCACLQRTTLHLHSHRSPSFPRENPLAFGILRSASSHHTRRRDNLYACMHASPQRGVDLQRPIECLSVPFER